MKQKTISLSREATLWEAGDVARDIGVVEAGRLGVPPHVLRCPQ